jgi:hypothetical protein
VQRPVDDANDVVVDLDLETTEEAAAFRRFLTTTVWETPENPPAVAEIPKPNLARGRNPVTNSPAASPVFSSRGTPNDRGCAVR